MRPCFKVCKMVLSIVVLLICWFSIDLEAVSKVVVQDFFKRCLHTSIPSQLSVKNTTSLEAQLEVQKRVFWPKIRADLSYQTSNYPEDVRYVNQTGQATYASSRLTLQQQVFNRVEAIQTKIIKESLQKSYHEHALAQFELLLQIQSHLTAYIKSKHLIQVYEDLAKEMDAYVTLLSKRKSRGLVLSKKINLFLVRQAEARLEKEMLQQEHRVSETMLLHLSGLTKGALDEVASYILKNPSSIFWDVKGVQNMVHPVIVNAQKELQIATLIYKKTTLKSWPTVSLFGRFGYKEKDTIRFNKDNEDWVSGVNISLPIFDFLETHYQKKVAKTGIERSELKLQEAKQAHLDQEVFFQYQMAHLKAKSHLLRAQLKLESDRYNEAQKKFQQNMIPKNEVLLAKSEYEKVKLNESLNHLERAFLNQSVQFYNNIFAYLKEMN